jgi:hypothetical protein
MIILESFNDGLSVKLSLPKDGNTGKVNMRHLYYDFGGEFTGTLISLKRVENRLEITYNIVLAKDTANTFKVVIGNYGTSANINGLATRRS